MRAADVTSDDDHNQPIKETNAHCRSPSRALRRREKPARYYLARETHW